MARNSAEFTATASILDRLVDSVAGLTGLSGLVTGPSGQPVVNAVVKMDTAAKTQPMETLTQDKGRYDFPRLGPGLYELICEAPGCKKYTSPEVQIETRQPHTLNIAMIAGDPGEIHVSSTRARPTGEVSALRSDSVRRMKQAVRRDLEWLLNTRRIAVEPEIGFKELNQSLYMYGIPDLSSFSLSSPKDRTRLLRILQNAIKVFEPRLSSVKVAPVDIPETGRSAMHFRIEGLLMMDPAPESVSFDTVLKLSSGEYEVKGEPDAG